MASIAVRKKVISIDHFSLCFQLQLLRFFLFVRSNQEQLYVLNALKIREKFDLAKWARWAKILKITHPDDQLKYSKTSSQMSSYAHWHIFLYLHAHTSIQTFFHLSNLNSEKKDCVAFVGFHSFFFRNLLWSSFKKWIRLRLGFFFSDCQSFPFSWLIPFPILFSWEQK